MRLFLTTETNIEFLVVSNNHPHLVLQLDQNLYEVASEYSNPHVFTNNAFEFFIAIIVNTKKGSLCIFHCVLTPLMAKMHYCNFAIKAVNKQTMWKF